MVGRTTGLTVIPRTCDYVAQHGKRDFADVIRLRIFRWRVLLDYPCRPNAVIRVFVNENGSQENRSQRRRRENGSRGWDDVSTGIEDGRWKGSTSQRAQAASGTWKRQETDAPLRPPDGTQLCQHFDSSPLRPIWDFQLSEL